MEKGENTSGTAFWKGHQLGAGTPKYLQIGDLHSWIQTGDSQLQLVSCRSNSDGEEKISENCIPEKAVSDQWSLQEGVDVITVVPVFPDKAIVVKPEVVIRILPSVITRLYIQVPVWVRFEVEQMSGKSCLKELPTIELSSTWFGDFAAGELCYWLSSGVRIQTAPDVDHDYLAICPIILANKSDKELEIKKFKLQVSKLSMYLDKKQLWSDDIFITYKGDTDPSQIKISGKAPEEISSAVLLSKPRQEGKRSFTSRTFSSILNISGISSHR